MTQDALTRRTMMARAAAAAAVLPAAGAFSAQGGSGEQGGRKPERPSPTVQGGPRSGEEANPAAGRPVSETAAAQGGEPKVPGPPPRKVGFALVGIGKLATEELIPAFRMTQGCELRALVTGDPDKGRAFADRLGIDRRRVLTYDQMERLRDEADVDAVYIATPNSLHRRDVERAAAAGKHVLCEKPMATTEDDCRAMIDACGAAGRRLMIAYRVHYEPINNRVRAMLWDGRYGKPHFVVFDTVQDVGRAPQYRLDAERNGGGSLFDIGIYALNTTRWLLGEEPTEIQAMRWSDPADARFADIEQNLAFQMRFPSGCLANCTSSFGTARVNRYKVMCAKGWVGMEPATNYRGLEARHGDDEGEHELRAESANQFALEMDHFAGCVRDGKDPDTPGQEGLTDVRLMAKIYEAAAAGRAVKV